MFEEIDCPKRRDESEPVMESVTAFLNRLASEGVRFSAESGRLDCYVPKGKPTSDIREGIIRHRSAILALFERREQCRRKEPGSVTSVELPLSAGQKGLYVLQKLRPSTSAYNVPLCFRINTKVDPEILDRAWGCVLDQFPILTARVVETNGSLHQVLDDRCRTAIRRRDVDVADDEQLLGYLQAEAKQPFDLNRGPLTRAALISSNGTGSFLLLTVHHIVFDGASAAIVLRSLSAFYEASLAGKEPVLSHESARFQEFVAWESSMLASAEGTSHAAYWQQQLSGDLPVLEPLGDVSRNDSAGFEARTRIESLTETLSGRVRDLGKVHSVQPAAILFAAFELLLHRYTNRDDIIIGMPVMTRGGRRFAGAVGYFVNMVPLRVRSGGRIRMIELLRRVRGAMLDAVYHSSYPLPLMLEKLNVEPARKRSIVRVFYAFQNFDSEDGAAALRPNETMSVEHVPEIAQDGDFDLGLEVFERGRSFNLHLKHDLQVFTPRSIDRFVDHYRTLLEAICENPDRWVHEYPILGDEERRHLLVANNDTRADYPNDRCLHELFAEQAGRHALETAVICEGERVTYQQLHARSSDLALYLQAEGVGPESRIGLYMKRSLDMIVGLLGALQAGGAYVPLDASYPGERVAHMLRDSQVSIVLTEAGLARTAGSLARQGTKIFSLDTQWSEISGRVAALRAAGVELRRDVRPRDAAYVIYTSGSTGRPKGVVVEHRGLCNLAAAQAATLAVDADSCCLQCLSFSFDACAFEVVMALCHGASLHIFRQADGLEVEGLARFIEEQGITHATLTPALLAAMPDEALLASVTTLVVAGEVLTSGLVRRWAAGRRMFNAYGPTEATVWSTVYACDPKEDGDPPIGRPIANTQVYVLDKWGEPAPVGVAGELYIGGVGVGRGYLNRSGLTAERFVADPFSAEPGARMYQTGDLGRWREDGNLEYLGRVDTQVKVRGFRIELGEIECRLKQHPEIRDTAVVAQGRDPCRQLVAFYLAKESNPDHLVELPHEELRRHLAQTLPDSMVPAAFVSLAAIPLNANGKVDRPTLARMDVKMASGRAYVAPRNETEERLVAMWAEVLNLAPETIGVNDNFFELGGHSLLATRLLSKVRSHLDVDVPLKAFFETAGVAGLAKLIETEKRAEIPAIRAVDRSQYERLPLSLVQERLWLIAQLEPDSPGYNLPYAVSIRGVLDIDQLDQAFNLVIARHETMRTVFPNDEGEAWQRPLDRVSFRLERVDLSHYATADARDDEVRRRCRTDATTPFDLARGPLLRATVMKLSEQEQILMLNMHHIISDGWSLEVLIKELGMILDALRHGRHPELPPLPIQYADYSVWQRRLLKESGVLERQLSYWREKLAGAPENLGLAIDHARPRAPSLAGAIHSFHMSARLAEQLKHLAEQQRGTLYMVLLAAFKTLLHRYTGRNDICVGGAIATRRYAETEGLIGMFVNTLALRSQVEATDTFVTLLSKVKATCLQAYDHQDAPFDMVIDTLRLERNPAGSPLFQVMLILRNTEREAVDPSIERYPLDSGISKFDLTVELTETAAGLDGSIRYRTALFKRESIARMAAHYTALCRAITTAPRAELGALDYRSEAERQMPPADHSDSPVRIRKGQVSPADHTPILEKVDFQAALEAAP